LIGKRNLTYRIGRIIDWPTRRQFHVAR
jgi:hypothetical protein